MQSKIYAWLVTLIGVLLVLPLINIDQLGTVTTGATSWIIALAILVIGIVGIAKSQ